MPTSTPSPHRFLASHATSSQKPKPKPPSSLRHGVTAQTHEDAPLASTPRATPAKRFVIAPTRNALHNARRVEREDHSHFQATPRPKPSLQKVESINEQSSSLASQAFETRDANIVDLTGDNLSQEAAEDEDEDAELLFTPPNRNKRRRLSHEPPSSPTQPFARLPHLPQTPSQAPVSALAASSHRFIVPASRTPGPPPSSLFSAANATPVPSRPHFILPAHPTSPVKPSTPGPETFSPSRKGQKFVPGGLASTLQSWVIETANTGYQSQIKDTVVWGRDKEDGVKVRIQLSELRSGKTVNSEDDDGSVECYQGGMVLAKGTVKTEEPEVKVLLAGLGGVRGSGHVTLRKGEFVGIRAPLWTMLVENEKWMVAVDWLVL